MYTINVSLHTHGQDETVAVWDMISPMEIFLRKVLVGHVGSVNAVDFDEKYIVSGSLDKTIKVCGKRVKSERVKWERVKREREKWEREKGGKEEGGKVVGGQGEGHRYIHSSRGRNRHPSPSWLNLLIVNSYLLLSEGKDGEVLTFSVPKQYGLYCRPSS